MRSLLAVVLLVAALLGTAACAEQYEWNRPGLTSQQRADIAMQYLRLRQMTRSSDDGWGYTPMRTPQIEQAQPLIQIPVPTRCTTTGPYGFRTTSCY